MDLHDRFALYGFLDIERKRLIKKKKILKEKKRKRVVSKDFHCNPKMLLKLTFFLTSLSRKFDGKLVFNLYPKEGM